MSQDTLFSLPESSPPPLELARRRLDALTTQRNTILDECDGDDGELDHSLDWKRLCDSVRDAEREVRRLEEIAATEAK